MKRRNFLSLGVPDDLSSDNASQITSIGRQTQPEFATRTAAGLEPYTPTGANPWDYSKAAHLLRRCMVGPKDTEIRKAVTDGLDATVKLLLTPFSPSLEEIKAWAGADVQVRPPNNDLQSKEYQDWQTALFFRREQLVKWWIKTTATSPVSIQERLVMMWHNHFANEINTVNFADYMLVQNQLFRKYALGNFKQFVKDVTIDPSMLIYLDGIKNFKTGKNNQINENYSRELQELFTCGVVDWDNNPNYTQTDVSEAAKALSGWSITPSTSKDPTSYFGLTGVFLVTRWDPSNKTFMGKTGAWKADDIVNIIFSERADQVAKFICTKIYREFVYDVPDRTIVEAMAATFKSNNWELKPVIEQLIRSEHFFDVANIGAMNKSPIDFMLGAIRSLGLTNIPDFNLALTGKNTQDLLNRMAAIGQVPCFPPNVKGWPAGRTWISTSTLPLRQKFMLDVADEKIVIQKITYYKLDAIAFAKTFPSYNDATKLSQEIAQSMLNVPPSQQESAALLDALLQGAKPYEWKIDDPTFQADKRIRSLLKAIAQLAKHELY
jgi:uncharacterized protein (DUF1800 family)